MKRMKRFPLVFAVATGWFASGVVQGDESFLTKPIEQQERVVLFPTAEMINQGREVAATICASCHGLDGVSDGAGKPHLAGQRAIYLYRAQQVYHNVARQDEASKYTGLLNNQALLAVAAYYASLTPASNPGDPAAAAGIDALKEDPFMGIRTAMKKCVKCHGETGNSTRSGIPSLTGQAPEYFVVAMNGYVNGGRSHGLMGKLVGDLDETTIKDMGVFYAVQDPAQTKIPAEGNPKVGERLSQQCAGCHGEDGNARKPTIPSLAGQDAKYFTKAMNHYKNGERQHQKMFEAAEALSEQDMIDLAAYYAGFEPSRRDVRAPLKSTEWIVRCERCHGKDGNSTDPRFPMLAGQERSYLRKSLDGYVGEGRDNKVMHAMAGSLSQMDVERIAAFFASRQPKSVLYIQLPCEAGEVE